MRFSRLLALIVLSLGACHPAQRMLVVFHTNDIHAWYCPGPQAQAPESLAGGFAALDKALAALKPRGDNWILVDAGDLLSGQPAGDLVWEGIKGGHMVRFMNLLGYHAMAVGNHDLDHGLWNLSLAMQAARFPFLAANLRAEESVAQPWTVVRRGGIRVGIVGVTTEGMPWLVSPEVRERIQVLPVLQVADSLARLLDPVTDVIVLLSHCGLEVDRTLARTLAPRVDLVVGGHSHHRLPIGERVGRALVVQAGSGLRDLGMVRLWVKRGRVVRSQARLVALGLDSRVGPVKALADSLDQVLEEMMGDTIGILPVALTRAHHGESSLGSWAADAIRWFTGAHVAMVNSGTFRADIPPGPLTVRKIRNAMPFSNSVVTFPCTGKVLRQILLYNARAAMAKSHGILQLSGCTCVYDSRADSVAVEVAGAPLRDDATYLCATIDFVASRAPSKYLGVVPTDVYDHGALLSQVVERAVRAGSLPPPNPGRLVLPAREE